MKNRLIISIITIIILCGLTACDIKNTSKQSNKRNENVSQIEIITDYINIRKEKSTKSDIIGKVNKGEIYTIISKDESNDIWIEIETSNKIHGFVSGRNYYVKYLESKDEKNNKYKSKYQKYEWNCDVPITEIKTIKDNGMMDIQPKLFITKDGKLYEFTLNKKYSNEQICKQINADTSFNYFNMFPNDRDLSLMVDNNNNFYYYEKSLLNFKEWDKYHFADTTNYILSHPQSYTTYANEHIENAGSAFYNYYAENNDIYKRLLYWKDSSTVYENPVLLHQFTDENVIGLEGKIFKTDKGFYKIGATNKEECEKYEDIECNEGIVKIEDVSKHYKDIEYFNGNYLIFKNDNNIYTYY